MESSNEHSGDAIQSGKAGTLKKQNSMVAFSSRLFGKYFSDETKFSRTTKELAKSKTPMTTGEFLSTVALFSLAFGIVVVAFISYLALEHPHLAFLLYSISFLAIVAFIAVLLEIPNIRSRSRTRDINAKLPVAIAFVATLASADISIDEIMLELSEAEEFGEISREARSISLSSRMFGRDIVSAIQDAAENSPSTRLSDFLQGITTTVTTGGNLKLYFTTKSKEYYGEQENQIKKNSESVGIMSESYITVGVAFPLILMIIIGVVGALSPVSPTAIITFLLLIAFIMIPALAILFIFLLRSTLKEVET